MWSFAVMAKIPMYLCFFWARYGSSTAKMTSCFRASSTFLSILYRRHSSLWIILASSYAAVIFQAPFVANSTGSGGFVSGVTDRLA